MEIKLKPCPFCGAGAKKVLVSIVRGVQYGYCKCTKCCITQDQFAEGRLDEAIDTWNRRFEDGSLENGRS